MYFCIYYVREPVSAGGIETLSIRIFLKCQYRRKIIAIDYLVLPFKFAFETTMEDLPRVAKRLNRNRLHESATQSSTISGMDIDMLTIEAAWTMIRKAVSYN